MSDTSLSICSTEETSISSDLFFARLLSAGFCSSEFSSNPLRSSFTEALQSFIHPLKAD